jgi:hypothetical protein
MQLTDWRIVEVALLLFGLTKISWKKSRFDLPSVIESPLRLRAHEGRHYSSPDGKETLDTDILYSTVLYHLKCAISVPEYTAEV